MKNTYTLFDMFLKVTSLYKDSYAFVYKINGAQIKVTYKQLFNDVLLLSKHFKDKGLKKGDKVMFLSDNRYEWIVTDLAILSLGAISVPRAAEISSEELEYIISNAGCNFLIIENRKTLVPHSQLLAKLNLSHIFFMSAYGPILEQQKSITQNDINDFVKLHQSHKMEDVFTIIYTSGTTGKPKGVMINHINMMYNVDKVPKLLELKQEDVWLSILPPWHVFERGVEYVSLSHGCKMVYSSAQTFSKDLEYYQPTLVASVPRVWEAIYSKIDNALAKTPFKATMFSLFLSISKSFKRNKRVLQNRVPQFQHESAMVSLSKKIIPLFKLILLSPLYFIAKRKLSIVQKKFGGRLRYAISGGSAFPEYLDEWIEALNIKLINSYGMTECSPSIAGRAGSCDIFGTVGAPLEGTELRVVDDRTQNVEAGVVGEIQIKGPQVMSGYYNNEIENIKNFTADGFLRTGDLGKFTINGELILTGRSKETIVLSNGENIDPYRIESAISILPFIKDSMLVGHNKKGLGLLIVADLELLKEYVNEHLNMTINSVEELTNDHYTLKKMKMELNAILHKDYGFKPFEKLQNIHFLEDEFKIGEEMTNTFKKKRDIIEKKYQTLIDDFIK